MLFSDLHASQLITVLVILFSGVGVGFAFIGQNNLALVLFIIASLAGFFTKKFRQIYKPNEGQLTLGIELERFSKVIVYGLLPFVYLVQITDGSLIGLIIGALYLLMVSIRLAHFNRSTRFLKKTKDGFTEGLDVYVSAFIIPLVSLLGYVMPIAAFGNVLAIVYLILGILYILPIEIPKLPSSWFLYGFIAEVIIVFVLLFAGNIA